MIDEYLYISYSQQTITIKHALYYTMFWLQFHQRNLVLEAISFIKWRKIIQTKSSLWNTFASFTDHCGDVHYIMRKCKLSTDWVLFRIIRKASGQSRYKYQTLYRINFRNQKCYEMWFRFTCEHIQVEMKTI